MKECETLNSLDELLSFDVENQFGWSAPQQQLQQQQLHHHNNNTIGATNVHNSGNGFCEISSSPDSCYYSDRSRAASGDEPLSPVTPLCAEFRRLPSLDDAMTAIENAAASQQRHNHDRRILIDLSAASVNGDLFDPSLCDLLLDSSGNEKDGGLVFETVDDPTSWTYLETVPTLQTYMKSEEDHNHLPDVLANRGDVIRSYVGVPQWQDQAHVIVQVPPAQWSEVDNSVPSTSYVLLEDNRPRHHPHQSFSSSASVPIHIERRESSNTSSAVFQSIDESSALIQQDAPKRQGRRQREEVENRVCHVCGERAGKHSYYGGQVCPSCRAFFRRSVQSKYSDSYKCSKDGQCEIRLKTRKNCQYCRFKLCEQSGMRRSWVLADGERKRLTALKSSNKVLSISTGCSGNGQVSPAMSDSSSLLTMDKDESDQIQDCLDKMTMIRNQTEDMNPEAMEEIALMLKERSKQISNESRAAMKKVLEQRTRLFALNIPEFTSLNSHDQIMLLEENKGPLIAFRVATFFHTEVNWRQQIGMILGQSDVTRLTESLSGLQLAEDSQLMYEQFFVSPSKLMSGVEPPAPPPPGSPLHAASDDPGLEAAARKEHKRLLRKISHWVEDETTFCLMNLIILFCTDQTSHLDARGHCEALQTHFSNLLFRYLLSRYNRAEARSKFAEGIRLVSYCRELNTLAAKAKLCRREPEEETN